MYLLLSLLTILALALLKFTVIWEFRNPSKLETSVKYIQAHDLAERIIFCIITHNWIIDCRNLTTIAHYLKIPKPPLSEEEEEEEEKETKHDKAFESEISKIKPQ